MIALLRDHLRLARERHGARTGEVGRGVHRRVEGRRHAEDADQCLTVCEPVTEVARSAAGLADRVAVGLAEGTLGAGAGAVALPAFLAVLTAERRLALRVCRAGDEASAGTHTAGRGVLADLTVEAGVARALTVAASALSAAHIEIVAEAAELTRLADVAGAGARAGASAAGRGHPGSRAGRVVDCERGLRLRARRQVEGDRQAADRDGDERRAVVARRPRL